NYFIALQIPSVELDSFRLVAPGYDTTWQYNIVASIPGTQTPERILILGAHHDAMSGGFKNDVPGADDNASGVAAVLEVARVLREKKYVPRNTIRFLSFAAEEVVRLLMGSRNYAKKAAAAGMDIRLMVNMDMLAWTSDTANWQMNVYQYHDQEWIFPMVKKAVEKVSPITVFHPGAIFATDCYAFYARGYPAVGIGENLGLGSHPIDAHPYYHTKNDRVENYDLRYCTELVKGISAIMLYADDSLQTVEITQKKVSAVNTRPVKCRYNPSTKMINITMQDNYPGYPENITLYSAKGRKLYTVNIPEYHRDISFYPEPLTSQGVIIVTVSYSGRLYRDKITLVK
ncbi:M28 family metallopeptidase, partial [Pseudoalteromonas sp.]|uniref:M28 family metallopeptidase n=1 Tax=Pseudoalteromonas sp. TaxID=53249 RepID=UPI00260C778B